MPTSVSNPKPYHCTNQPVILEPSAYPEGWRRDYCEGLIKKQPQLILMSKSSIGMQKLCRFWMSRSAAILLPRERRAVLGLEPT